MAKKPAVRKLKGKLNKQILQDFMIHIHMRNECRKSTLEQEVSVIELLRI